MTYKDDGRKFVELYEGSKTAQKFVTDFENTQFITYEERLTEQHSTTIDIRDVQGELADVIRALLKVSEATPVTVTMTEKGTRENERWRIEMTFNVEAGEANQVFTGASYYGALAYFVEWLETAN